jgi:hypothetical protein
LSSFAAPKPTHSKPTHNKPTDKSTDKACDQEPADAATAQAPSAIEMIEPSTGEIIVLAQHKPAAKDDSKAKAEEQVTPLAKPEKRTKGRAKLKTKPAEDGTTPMTATAKSDAGAQTGAKSAEVLAANAARKERKAAEKAKAARSEKGGVERKGKAKSKRK